MKLAASPIAFEQYDPHTKQVLKQNFGVLNNLETVWPGGICLPSIYRDIADKVYNLPLRPSDVWVLSFPKTGESVCFAPLRPHWVITRIILHVMERTYPRAAL